MSCPVCRKTPRLVLPWKAPPPASPLPAPAPAPSDLEDTASPESSPVSEEPLLQPSQLDGTRSRDAVTGLAAFRSVCWAWRAVGRRRASCFPTLVQARSRRRSTALIFPLSRGWSIVVDARNASCHLSHLATGATAALANLNAVWDGGRIRNLSYVHRLDAQTALCSSSMLHPTYLDFTDLLRFAVHVPPDAPAAEGATIMMYHMMQGRTDAAWTKVAKPNPIGYGFFDFAYHDGRMFGMDTSGEMAVYDAATLDVLRPRQVGFGRDQREVFNIFELGSTPDGPAWLKAMDAGNYELFLDGYHTIFQEKGAKRTRGPHLGPRAHGGALRSNDLGGPRAAARSVTSVRSVSPGAG
ncbi:LOW QUALITY PROTEIN: hypothetical protein SETIT_7G146900v2 [Setaria italica]|uniref:KIB1-4 beta-propeller domain-containing protein n=1 Tax=Setaria italica TaxID=4555 RepID=A0A368RVZ7_SETIT|nr:LOW QUALITY PROTEIN: hypothetical protein SETIT_7G146900v2 [Setaria italica]